MTGIIINTIDNQFDNALDIPIKIISWPKYPGCLILLYNPVSINLWFSTFETTYVKYLFSVNIAFILINSTYKNQYNANCKKHVPIINTSYFC